NWRAAFGISVESIALCSRSARAAGASESASSDWALDLESGRKRDDIQAGRGLGAAEPFPISDEAKIDRRRKNPDERSRDDAKLRGRRFTPFASDGPFGLF